MTGAAEETKLRRYYRWHSRIYDLTRWSFLFGRSTLVDSTSASGPRACVLEIGCGTGVNLRRLARAHPNAQLVGLDASPAMLSVARRNLHGLRDRITLHEGFYKAPMQLSPAPDLIVISYCLSMINPGWQAAISAAVEDLAPGGCLAIVDFHGSAFPWFRRWMACNHVRMEDHLAPELALALPRHRLHVLPAFGGLWHYFLFLGYKSRLPGQSAESSNPTFSPPAVRRLPSASLVSRG